MYHTYCKKCKEFSILSLNQLIIRKIQYPRAAKGEHAGRVNVWNSDSCGAVSFGVGGDGSDRGADEADEVGRGDFDLEAADSGTDIDCVEVECGRMEVGREALLHSDRGAASADVSCHGEQVLHQDHLDLLVT